MSASLPSQNPSDNTPVVTPDALAAENLQLTPEQLKKWRDTMSAMAWTCPGFRHLFYKLLVNNSGTYGAMPTRSVPIAATDGRNILINPDTFFNYTLPERVFIMGHEVIHNVYNDVEFLKNCTSSGQVPQSDGTVIPFRNSTMQKAMDFRINALLKESRIGHLPANVFYDTSIATGSDSVVDVYKRVWDDEEDNNGAKTGGKAIDYVLGPGSSSPASPRSNGQWGVEMAAAKVLENMKRKGNMPGGLMRMFEDFLNPVVPWTEHIRGIFNRKVGSGSYDWKKPDRRFIVRDIHMPSKSGNGAGWVVCWGDTSGSIGQDEMQRYLAELSGIIEDCRPQRITVIWCDAEIKQIDEIEDAGDLERIRHSGAPGGGGTSVHPVFDWISESLDTPEIFIGFTDGYVAFPDTPPPYPCIWAMTTQVDAPFGENVRINPER